MLGYGVLKTFVCGKRKRQRYPKPSEANKKNGRHSNKRQEHVLGDPCVNARKYGGVPGIIRSE
jgi:hypothetical protein